MSKRTTKTTWDLSNMSAQEIKDTYWEISRKRNVESDAMFDIDEDNAMKIDAAGTREMKRLLSAVKRKFFYRVPSDHIVDDGDKGLFYPVADGWRESVRSNDATEIGIMGRFEHVLTAAVSEFQKGAKKPTFEV